MKRKNELKKNGNNIEGHIFSMTHITIERICVKNYIHIYLSQYVDISQENIALRELFFSIGNDLFGTFFKIDERPNKRKTNALF